jgi:hypothetical protein
MRHPPPGVQCAHHLPRGLASWLFASSLQQSEHDPHDLPLAKRSRSAFSGSALISIIGCPPRFMNVASMISAARVSLSERKCP